MVVARTRPTRFSLAGAGAALVGIILLVACKGDVRSDGDTDLSASDLSASDLGRRDATPARDGPETGPDGASLPGLTTVELTLVDGAATTYYATFQSHNQKLVANAAGIFLTHLHAYDDSGGDAETKAEWRLLRSQDGGKSFVQICSGVAATKAPAIETDPQNNVYLVSQDWTSGNAYLTRFEQSKGYADPTGWTIPGGAAGKYAMIYDTKRSRLVYLTWSRLFILGTSGQVIADQQFFTAGPNAYPQYPHLTRSPDATDTLFAAWTTTATADDHYYDIHFVASWDGGGSWGLPLPGQMVTLPIVADDTGPGVPITLPAERSPTKEHWSWLSNVFYKDWKVHFLYAGSDDGVYRTTYARYDWNNSTPGVDVRVSPSVKGQQIELQGLDGFFASDLTVGSRLFLTSKTTSNRIGILASDDNGGSWYDYAVSDYSAPAGTAIYAVGGARQLSPDGDILGAFTEQNTAGGTHKVYFFRARADVQPP